MAPLILHNVPDEELFVGEDGVRRPYGLYYPGSDGHANTSRARKPTAESGPFGKSIRRSRSKTATPAKREDPTLAAAETMFSEYLSNLSPQPSENTARKASLPTSTSQPNLSSQVSAPLAPVDANASTPSRYLHKQPTEVILRGFQSNHQYAAIKHYENIAGRICEDYPREPPQEQRRYKSDLRDPASLRKRPLTSEEKAKALRFAGGENWIKVTFESHEAAESALYASPQVIQGFLVYAEEYRGLPPTNEEAIPASGIDRSFSTQEKLMQRTDPAASAFSASAMDRGYSTLTRSLTTPAIRQTARGSEQSISPPGSNTSSNTLDTCTLSTATASSGTIIGLQKPTESSTTSSETLLNGPTSVYCRKIPGAKRVQLLPASDALLPTKSLSQRILAKIPLLGSWSSGAIIGSEIPRTETGEFSWEKASLYWRLVWWLDNYTGLFGGDVAGEMGKDD